MGSNRWIGALRQRNFRVFFIGQTASRSGPDGSVAVSFAVLAHGSASDVGFVLSAGTVPLVVFLLVGGVIGDRMSRRLVMLGSDVLRFLAEGVLGVDPRWSASTVGLHRVGRDDGVGQAFFTPAMTGLVTQMLDHENLQQGNALNGLAESGEASSVLHWRV